MAKVKLVLRRHDFSRVADGVFSVPVTLPVGPKIVKATYYHAGTRSPYSSLRVMRVKTGEEPDKLGNKSATDATGTPIPVDVPITGDPIIRGAYRYYILVSLNPSSIFDGVNIVYRQ